MEITKKFCTATELIYIHRYGMKIQAGYITILKIIQHTKRLKEWSALQSTNNRWVPSHYLIPMVLIFTDTYTYIYMSLSLGELKIWSVFQSQYISETVPTTLQHCQLVELLSKKLDNHDIKYLVSW